ncbi:gliding motility-associated C-terminal domain-containing protein [Ferruginibacter albus]|uniref:gliding motility-associated C-terminal domain-containing protein n=1 Tax=Ferruginibacter albus TaxID=2875540 RepID=UPI001CC65F6D|nr:gliding motility-associated C-terminal domain-containing protein [Ferruginibacter albus]UAY53537.1 gliding motility-associated C-terminal domain-containing protein [Ferruginibacter albus]
MKQVLSFLFTLAALQSFCQQRILVKLSNGDLYSLNVPNCSSKFIGSTNHGFGDISFTSDGRLWGIENLQLFQIDTTTANVTLVGTTGLDAVSLVELNDSTLLMESHQDLYGVHVRDASSYYIGHIGYQAAGDLTWYDNDLYLTASGQLIKIVLNNTQTQVISAAPVNSLSNPIPTCEGSATGYFQNNYNAILGFSGQNVYKICPIDGSYTLICPSIVPDGISGGATLRLPVQVPLPVTCDKPTAVFSNVTAGICDGETLDGHSLAGTYTDTFVAQNGADSIRTLTLQKFPAFSINIIDSIGDNEDYKLPSGELVHSPGVYKSTLKTVNDCDSIINTTLLLKAGSICSIKPPKVFTPNGDEINDEWVIAKPYCIKLILVDVYNRWGGLVYHSDNYQNDWNGKYNDKPLPDATYYYVIRILYSDNTFKTLTGNVIILR